MWDIFARKIILHNSAQQWEQAWELCSMQRTESSTEHYGRPSHFCFKSSKWMPRPWLLVPDHHMLWRGTDCHKVRGFLTRERQLDGHEHFPSFLDKMVCLYLAGRFHRVEALLFLFGWLAGFCFVCMCVYACVRFNFWEIRSDWNTVWFFQLCLFGCATASNKYLARVSILWRNK